MPSTFTTSLRLEQQADGEGSSVWGQKQNNNHTLLEQAVAGVLSKSVAGAADVTLTASNGAADESRNLVHKLTGVLTGSINVIVPTASGWHFVDNQTTGAFTIKVKTAAGTGVFVPQGFRLALYCDGVNVVDAITALNSLSMNGAIDEKIATAVVSTATCNIWATDGNYVHITGNTGPITSLGTAPKAGATRTVILDSNPQINNGANLILPGGANIQGAAGDVFIARAETTSQIRVIAYFKANGQPVAALGSFTSAVTIDLATTGTNLTLQTEDGGNVGVTLLGYHNSATPVAPDDVLIITARGRNSTPADQDYAKLRFEIVSASAASAEGKIRIQTPVAGSAVQDRMTIGQGVQVHDGAGATPTDGDMGIGWINAASGFAVNGMPAAFIPKSTNKSANYNIAKTDCGQIFRWTTAGFNAAPQAATNTNGFVVGICNDAASGDVTFVPVSGTINGVASIPIPPGYGVWIQSDGANYFTVGVIQGPGIPIGRVIAAASATLDLSFAAVPTKAREINFHYEDFVPSAGSDIWMRVSTDGGATYDQGASNYAYIGTIVNTAGGTAAGPTPAGAAQILLSFNNVTTNAAPGAKVNVYGRIRDPKRTVRPMIECDTAYPTGASSIEGGSSRNFRLTDHSIDGIRAMFSTGNIVSGALEAWWN